METPKNPDLADVIEPLLAKYGLTFDNSYDKYSARPTKINIKMKTWADRYGDVEVFIYEDNTVGLRCNSSEVEGDLNAVDPSFCTKLEKWLKQKVKA